MKVKVIQRGFLNRLWEPGETLEIEDHQFSETWMVEEKPKRGRPKKEVIDAELVQRAED